MKKITSLVIALFAMATTASAQYNVSGHRFFDNWSIGIDGGVTTNLHDFDTPNGGIAGLQLTKDVSFFERFPEIFCVLVTEYPTGTFQI